MPEEEEDESTALDDHDPLHEVEFRRQALVSKKFTSNGGKCVEQLATWDWNALDYSKPELVETLKYLYVPPAAPLSLPTLYLLLFSPRVLTNRHSRYSRYS